EVPVILPVRHLYPIGFRVEQHVHTLGGRRQRRIDCGGMRMYELRPLRVVQPKRAAASGAEMSLARADAAAPVLFRDSGVVDAQVLLPLDLQGVGVGTQVDRAT